MPFRTGVQYGSKIRRPAMAQRSVFGILIVMSFCYAISAQAPQGQPAQTLPEGNAKAIVNAACTTCHAVTMITGSGHTKEEWKLLVERMMAAGADVPANQTAIVTDYLAKNF